MRQFATIHSITDLQGYPVTGDRLYFYSDETTLATITDAEGTAIDNPQRIVNGHTEKQVFLPDTDIRIVQKTCVDAEDDAWESVSTWIDKAPSVLVSVSGGLPSVDTIEELRNLDTAVGLVELRGYNEAGDKPAMYYKWNATSVGTDSGLNVKSTVSGTTAGRWEAITDSDYVDVRHFGVFPQSGRTEEQHAAISSAFSVSLAFGKRLYFPAVNSAVNYEIGGCYITFAKFDNNVRLFSLGSAAYLTDCENAYAYGLEDGGAITITADELRSSQNSNVSLKVVLAPRKTLYLDTDYGMSVQTVTGVNVVLEHKLTNSMRFKNCTFSGQYTIKASSQGFYFTGCEINQSMFDDDCDYSMLSFTNCTSDQSMWDSVAKYIKYCQLNGSPIIDMGGRSVSDDTTITGSVTIKNATFTGTLTLSSASDVTLDSVTASKVATGSCSSLTLIRSTLTASESTDTLTVGGTLNAEQSTVSVPVTANSVIANATMFASDISTSSCNLNGCVSSAFINISPDSNDNYANVFVTGCSFTGDTSCVALVGEDGKTYTTDGLYVLNSLVCGTSRLIVTGMGRVSSESTNVAVTNNANTSNQFAKATSMVTIFDRIIARRLDVRDGTDDETYGAVLHAVERLRFTDVGLITSSTSQTYYLEDGDVYAVVNNSDASCTYTNIKQKRFNYGSGDSPSIGNLVLAPGAATLAVCCNGQLWAVSEYAYRS